MGSAGWGYKRDIPNHRALSRPELTSMEDAVVASMFVELQPWITVVLDSAMPVELPREHWLDALDYNEVALSVEISAFLTTGTATLRVQTALTDDPRGMVPMKNAGGHDAAFSGVTTPAQAAFIVPTHSSSPLRRWVRWELEASDSTVVSFRITALFRGAE